MLILRLRRQRALRRAQRKTAFQGLLLGLTAIAFAAAGSLGFGPVGAGQFVLLCGTVTCGALVGAYLLIPWNRVRPVVLLVFPTIWLLGLLVMSMRLGAFASNFVGLTVLAFLFGGITQRRWQTLWLLAPALPTWLVMVEGSGAATTLWLRLPIVLALWISASELVARHAHSINSEVTRLHRAVDIDDLTGLANRRVLPVALTAATPGDALLLIDIDYFKAINDQHGHSAGDLVLTQFGRMIRRCIRLDDEAIRYGGEEIMVVLRNAGPHGVTRFEDHLREEVSHIVPPFTYSAGCAILADGESAHQALERADSLLYDAKRNGRNQTLGDHSR